MLDHPSDDFHGLPSDQEAEVAAFAAMLGAQVDNRPSAETVAEWSRLVDELPDGFGRRLARWLLAELNHERNRNHAGPTKFVIARVDERSDRLFLTAPTVAGLEMLDRREGAVDAAAAHTRDSSSGQVWQAWGVFRVDGGR